MSGESGEASFNQAVATLSRHDFLLQKISAHALDKDYEGWLTTLKHLRREISPYIKEKFFDNITNQLKKLKEMEWLKVDEQGRKKVAEDKKDEVEELLDEITILIGKAMFDANILMARKEQEEGYD